MITVPPQNVAIIGAGLSGLCLALALHRNGIRSTVYEARTAGFVEGGAIRLSPNALRVLDRFGVCERFATKPTTSDFHLQGRPERDNRRIILRS